MVEKSVNIRGLDVELFRLARAEAIKEGKKIGEWLNEAIREKLERGGLRNESSDLLPSKHPRPARPGN